MRKIIPAVLESNLNGLRKNLRIAESLSKRIQIDVADGVFVGNKTVVIKESWRGSTGNLRAKQHVCSTSWAYLLSSL